MPQQESSEAKPRHVRGRNVRRWFGLMLGAALSACTVVVDSVDDEPNASLGNFSCSSATGKCTLRAAIEASNANFFVTRIEVPPGIYNLTLPQAEGGGPLQVSRTVSIRGAGAGATSINAGSNCSSPGTGIAAFQITGGDVNIRYLTIRGGNAQNGGGIGVFGGHLALREVELTDNFASTGGGGLLIASGATATVRRTNIRANCVNGAFGGGIRNSGQLFVHESLIVDNFSNRAGGIHNSGTLNLRSTTIGGNEATSSFAGVGGIAQLGFALLNNVTITQNAGRGNDPDNARGGGIQTTSEATTVLKNSIVAENDGRGGPNDCVGELTPDSRHNLIGESEGCEFAGSTATFLLDIPPELAPLADNGGPTRTHALLAGSPAREAGYAFPPPAADACEPRDQRGVPRPQGAGGCDLGAFEVTASNAFVTRFVLVDADLNADIQPLRDGELLVLSQLPPALSVRAEVSGAPGSVVFDFAGEEAYQIENVAPYALGGDNPPGNYHPVPLTPGAHTLVATPFAEPNGEGAAGGRLEIGFNVVGSGPGR